MVGTAALTAPRERVLKLLPWLEGRISAVYGPGGQPNAHARRYRADTMFYEVLVLSDGGERFTIERDAPLAAGERFSNESEFYRVLPSSPVTAPSLVSSKPSG